MRRRVHLHGIYADFVDGPIEIVATSVRDAIEAVGRLVPGFKPDPIHGMKKMMIAGINTREDLFGRSDMEDIHVFPAMSFGKQGGLLQVVVGVTLIVVGFLVAPYNPLIGQGLISAGLMSIAGGLLQMLQPQPKNTAEVRSRYISVNQNTVQIGTPIAIPYGLCMVGGQILSLSVVSQNQGTPSQ